MFWRLFPLLGWAALSAQDRGTGVPSTFTRRSGEVWSERGLRAVNDVPLVEAVGQRSPIGPQRPTSAG